MTPAALNVEGRTAMAKVTTAKVTTGSGDTGYTSLLGDQRVPKYDPRPDTYGTVDEATSALGMARAFNSHADPRQHILTMLRQVYVPCTEPTTPPEHETAPVQV